MYKELIITSKEKHELENRATLVSCTCDTNLQVLVHSRSKLVPRLLAIVLARYLQRANMESWF